jgi:hypothetical protein
LIVSPVYRIHGVSIDKLKSHGIVAGDFQVVLFSVKSGRVAEIA